MSLSCGVRNCDTGGMSLLRLAISEAEGKFRWRHILTVFRVSRAGHSCVSAMRARLCLCQNCIVYAYGRTPGCPYIGYLAHPFAIHFGFGTLCLSLLSEPCLGHFGTLCCDALSESCFCQVGVSWMG